MQNCLTQLEKSAEGGEESAFTPPRSSFIRKAYYRVRPDGSTAATDRAVEQGESSEEGSNGNDPQPGLWR